MVNEPVRHISLRGARQHNLKGIDLEFAIGQLTVICGVSGSGKTSLALKTLYAEGQRRYIESFSAYSRQFLQRIDKPAFDSLTNLPPSIAITRELRSRNNRSTVGTASEILEYLRVVFSNEATLACFRCGRPVESHNPSSVLRYFERFDDRRAILCFEIGWQTKRELSALLFDLQASGFIRLIVNGKGVHLADDERQEIANWFEESGMALVVVDRIKTGVSQDQERMTHSLATAFDHLDGLGRGTAILLVERPSTSTTKSTLDVDETMLVDGGEYSVYRFSTSLRCEHCQLDYPESEPRLFNFNNPIGACPSCEGFGEVVAIDMDKVIPDRSISLNDGAIAAWRTPAYSHELEELKSLASEFGIPMDTPISKLKPKQWRLVLEGIPERKFGGLNGFFAWLERKKYKMHVRAFLARWRTYSTCSQCEGRRLNPGALAYRLQNKSFAEICELSIDELFSFLSAISIKSESRHPKESIDRSNLLLVAELRSRYAASEPERQVLERLKYLQSVGLGYLSLSRPLHTLSGGEAQRVMMTTLLGSSLVDMLYVFDEPTVGLHPRDTERMADAILRLRDRGNTVILVEHEPHLMRIADRIIEIGPQAGELGGHVTFDGTPSELLRSPCATGQYLSGKRSSQRSVRKPDGKWIAITGASGRNLQVDQLNVPLNCLTVLIGASGSGKSTLILDTLCPAIERALDRDAEAGLPFESLVGIEHIEGCMKIDQSPIQRSTRSSPVTYSKAMDDVRQVFAETPDAKARGMGAGHFSFNSDMGRCSTCEGLGFTSVDMQFMADIQLPCSDCDGKRFKPEVLEVRFRDLNISEVLDMCVERAHAFFRGHAKVQEKLWPLMEIGLGYLPLGQSLATLSAGESMRLKLASQLESSKVRTGTRPSLGKLIVLDEPTTGLHFSDVTRLLQCIDGLIDAGHTVLVIEHNQQVIGAADHLIELGPGSGPNGGKIIASGSVDEVRQNPASTTGRFI
jgi:excinuclease ABC subunit A